MRLVTLVKEEGKDPAGIAPFPITWKLVKPVKAPTPEGMSAGTPGKVKDLS